MTDESYSNLWLINFDGSENRPITTGIIKIILQGGQIMEINLFLFKSRGKVTNFSI